MATNRGSIYPVSPEAQRGIADLLGTWMDTEAAGGKPRDPIQFLRNPGQIVYDVAPYLSSVSHAANWQHKNVHEEAEVGAGDYQDFTLNSSAFSNRLIMAPMIQIQHWPKFLLAAAAHPTNTDMSVEVAIDQTSPDDPLGPVVIWAFTESVFNSIGAQVNPYGSAIGGARAMLKGTLSADGNNMTLAPVYGPRMLALPGPVIGQEERTTFNISCRARLPKPAQGGTQQLYTLSMDFWQRTLYTDPQAVTR